MKKEKIDLFYGALLHDIGKVIQRATGERKKHALVGADWFDEIADNQVISDQIRYHMANYQSDFNFYQDLNKKLLTKLN